MFGRLASHLLLLRRNGRFRRLWYGPIVSQMGDWFHTIALYTLMLKLSSFFEPARTAAISTIVAAAPPAFLCTALGYALLGQAPSLAWGAAAVFVKFSGGYLGSDCSRARRPAALTVLSKCGFAASCTSDRISFPPTVAPSSPKVR